MAKSIALSALLCVFASIGLAQEEQAEPPGLDIGKKAPDFALKDQLGRPKQLSNILKTGPVALVFHRSAAW